MKWCKVLIGLSRLIFIVTIIYLVCIFKYDCLMLLLGSLLLTFVPEVYTKLTKVKIPMSGRLFYTGFILCSQWLGSYLGFYTLIPSWDILLHVTSGVLMGYVGLMMLIQLDQKNTLFKEQKIGAVVTFILAVSIAAAGIWEIIEFAGDTFLGTNAQLNSLRDTMEDIICGTVGSVLFAIYIGLRMKTRRESCVDELMRINREENREKNKE